MTLWAALFTTGPSAIALAAIALAACALAACALGLAMPPLIAALFDRVVPAKELEAVPRAIAILLALTAALHLLELLAAFFRLKLQARLDGAFKRRIMIRLLALPSGFFRRLPLGELLSRTGVADGEQERLLLSVLTGTFAGILALSSLLALFRLDLRIGLISSAAGALSLAWAARDALKKRRLEDEILSSAASLRSLLIELFAGISKLRSAGAETRLFERWQALFRKRQALGTASSRIGARSSVFHSVLPAAGMLVFFGGAGTASSAAPALAPGECLAALGAYAVFLAGMQRLSSAASDLACAAPLFKRAAPILAETPEIRRANARFHRLRGAIELRNVTLRYAPEGPPALNLSGRSVRIEPGRFVALIGPSGSGKSAFVRVLLGLERPDTGEVLYDGIPLSELDLREVRRQIGTVLQHDQLINGSLHENIAALRPISLTDTTEAARLVGLGNTLASLPMGMSTLVASEGRAFSGGERQRVMIARAIAGKPRILLLDEATSALDNAVQALVAENLRKMKATRVVVAHRLSAIRDADQVLTFDRGRLIEEVLAPR